MTKTFKPRADQLLYRKYGRDAWERVRYCGKIRNRLEQQLYEKYKRRMDIVAVVVPALSSAAITTLTIWILRGW